jgi:CheY-like chemotaxis protein
VQERQALDRAQGGLGLGLAIVRSLVQLHGGSVTAHSDGPGTGSEFVVRLPAAAPQPAETTAEAAPQPPTETTRAELRVLVVDDNLDAAELLVESLRSMGYRAEHAADGPEALRLAHTLRPDVALLDIGLPVMDGYELARHLQKQPGLGAVRLIAVTGYGQESDRRRSRAAGFAGHLVKPIHLAEVVDAIDQAARLR